MLPDHFLILHNHILLVGCLSVVVCKILKSSRRVLLKSGSSDHLSVFAVWSTALVLKVTVFLVHGRISLVKDHEVTIGGWRDSIVWHVAIAL